MTDDEAVEFESLERRLGHLLKQNEETVKEIVKLRGQMAELKGIDSTRINVSLDALTEALGEYFDFEKSLVQSESETNLPLYTIHTKEGHILQVLGNEDNLKSAHLFLMTQGADDSALFTVMGKFLNAIFYDTQWDSLDWSKSAISKIITAVNNKVKAGKKLRKSTETKGRLLTVQYHRKQSAWEFRIVPAKEKE